MKTRTPLAVAGVAAILAVGAALTLRPSAHQSAQSVHSRVVAGMLPATKPTVSSRSRPSGTYKLQSDAIQWDSIQSLCSPFEDRVIANVLVAAVSGAEWNTPDQLAPLGTWINALVLGWGIYTPVQFTNYGVLKDERSPSPLTNLGVDPTPYFLYGGSDGDATLLTDFPTVQPGQRYVIVALPMLDVVNGGFTTKEMMIAAAFPVDLFGKVTLQPQTFEQGQVSEAEVSMPISQLKSELASC